MCFIAAQPQAVEPLGANRGPIFFYITAWPKDGVKTEPSIKVGYPVKPDAEMSVTVGTDAFKLLIKGERGFVQDPTEELKLVEALKKGSNAFVKATRRAARQRPTPTRCRASPPPSTSSPPPARKLRLTSPTGG